MDLPNSNKLTSKRKVLIILGALVLIGVIILFFYLSDQKKNKNIALISSIPVGEGIQVFEQESTEKTSDTITEEMVINTVSTGEVRSYKMEDADTGEYIADASVLVVVTKDNGGNTKTLEIILQIFPTNDPEKNVFPAVLKTLSLINSTSFPSDKASNTQLEELFPRGSEWSFFPLVDPFSRFPLDTPEALFAEYSKKYSGKNVALIKEFLESGLTKNYDKPLLIIGMEMP